MKDKFKKPPPLVDDTGLRKPEVDDEKPKYTHRQVEELLAGKGAIDAGLSGKATPVTQQFRSVVTGVYQNKR